MAANYPPDNELIGDYLGAGACGFAFEVVGEPDKVLKVSRLVDYESIDPLTIADYHQDKTRGYGGWEGGIGLNEFQAVLFADLWDKQIKGEDISPQLPILYGFSSGEMQQSLLDEITNSYEHYGWDSTKKRIIDNSFKPRRGKTPGARVGLWVMEKLDRIGVNQDRAKRDVKKMNKWLRERNFVVRDTRNGGNWGQRVGSDEVVWFDPGVAPWPVKAEWKDSEDVKLRNLYWLFYEAFGGHDPDYEGVESDPDKYDKGWHQAEGIQSFSAEDEGLITRFLAEADSIGAYMDSGAAGSVFAINDDKVLKIAKLNHTYQGDYINRDQSVFMEDVWVRKNQGKHIPSEMVDIQHYNRGTVTPKMASLINKKSPAHTIEVGEPVAIWIMERIPTVCNSGDCDLDWDEINDAEKVLQEWGESIGYNIFDLHDGNYGQRADGSYVAFDPWPEKSIPN